MFIVIDTIMANKAINMSGTYHQLYIRQNSIPRSQLVRDADWLECYPISIKPFRDIFDSRNLEKETVATVVKIHWDFRRGREETRVTPPPPLSPSVAGF
jgi:hypothetical protein